MYNITRQGDTDSNEVIKYCCDKKEDVATLPTDVGPGSTCICIEDSSVYMLGGDKIWHEL